MTETDLFQPCEFNGLKLKNRIVMSALTRSRIGRNGAPGPMQAVYYAQRATAGLIITEATAVAAEGRGGAFTPSLYNEDHVAGWRLVTDAVHAAGGLIFAQLWHGGRISHSSFSPDGRAPGAPSPIKQPGQVFTDSGFAPFEEARELALDEMPKLVAQFRQAAEKAKAAGFDGVELHGAHSYLIDSFLRDMTNRRTDAYGGSVENRARLPLEVVQAMVDVWGGSRVCVRLAPIGHTYDAWDSDPEPLFTYVVRRLNEMGVGWLDMVEGDTGVSRTAEPSFDLQKLRRLFKGAVIANNLYDRELALKARRENTADLIAFGRPFIANPDLVDRLKKNAPLQVASEKVYYGGGERGYIDFPTLAEEAEATAST